MLREQGAGGLNPPTPTIVFVNTTLHSGNPDYYAFEEFDLDDPENIKMIQEEEEANIRKNGRITCEELDEICISKEKIIRKNPAIKRKNAFDLAWGKFTGKNYKMMRALRIFIRLALWEIPLSWFLAAT